MTDFDAKLLHFNLNLNYKQQNITIENQTNQLINYICNDFFNKFQKEIQEKYVVLEFQNDEISLLGYSILKAIQGILPFQLLIYGKDSILKQYNNNKDNKNKIKEKRISSFSFKRLSKKNKIIFISCYNPIYQVANQEKFFKEMDCYYLLKKFTPYDIKMGLEFYGIPIDDGHWIYNSKTSAFQAFCNGINDDRFNYKKILEQEFVLRAQSIEEINIVCIDGYNLDESNEILNDIVNKDTPIFYQCAQKEHPILVSEFQYYLKNKSNIYGYWNINTFDIAKEFQKQFNCKVNFYGNFEEKEKEKWLNA